MAPPPNRNLFKVSNGEPALVLARTQRIGDSATALLHQRGTGSRLLVGVAPAIKPDGTRLAQGRFFPIAVGDVATAALLIANVSGTDAAIDVFIGTQGARGFGAHTNPQLQNYCMWRVDLVPTDESAHLIVSATEDIVVQLMIDDGRVNGITCLPLA